MQYMDPLWWELIRPMSWSSELTPCSVTQCWLHLHPEDGGSMAIRNVVILSTSVDGVRTQNT